MKDTFRAVKISEKVYWVGAIDWGLRNFHGYLTSRGSTYNAFLILADKVTLIDTVKKPFFDEMMARIRSVIEPERIDYIISNHSEMDHSGALPETIAAVAPEKVFASSMGIKALKAHFHWDREITQLATGDSLDLGGAGLRFIEARMLHWPDSIFTFYEEEGILFSNDAFGMHLASSRRFADEIDETVLRYEGAKYYANILLHLSPLIERLIAKLPEFNLNLKMIAPDHGPLWRKTPEKIIGWYSEWAAQKPTNKAVIVYDTMWQSTAKMARAVADGIIAEGVDVKILPMDASHRSDVITEILDAGALVVGSPTMNNQLYPTVADVMTYIKGLKPRGLVGAAFGSYGWSGEAVKHLDDVLAEMKIERACESVKSLYVPDDEVLSRCVELGKSVASALKQKLEHTTPEAARA